MASDTQKTVEFALKLTGVDPKTLTPLITKFQKLDEKIQETQNSIKNLQTALQNIKTPRTFATFTENLSKLGAVKLKDLSPLATNLTKISKIEKLPPIGAFTNNLVTLSQTSLAGLGTLSKNLQAISKINVEATVAKLRDLNTALRALEKQGGLTTFARFATDVRAMRSALDNSQASINRITTSLNDIGNATQKNGLKLRSFAEKVQTVLTFRLISEGIIQAKQAIVNGISAIIEYDQALKDLQAITSATNTEVIAMGRKILEVASTTKFSASEVAAGMRTLGQAGFSATESIQTMQAVANLSTGTLSDMAQTVDLVTTAMRVFQVDASRSTEVADVFANAVNRSKLTIEKLRTAMNYVGPIAQDANISFKELSAAMMTLANSGIRASTIGTSLRQVFSQLVDPSKKFVDYAREAGVSMQDLDPTVSDLATVLTNLNLVLKDTGTAFDIFGRRGASAALALTASGSQYNSLLETVSRTGTAAEMAAKQMEGLGVSFKNLRDKLSNLAIAFGTSGVMGPMRVFVDVTRTIVDVLTDLTNTIGGKVIVSTLAWTVGLGLLVGLFAGLWSVLKTSTLAVFVVQVWSASKAFYAAAAGATLFQMALGPIAVALAAISAVGFYLFQSMRDGAKEASEEAAILAGTYENLRKRVQDYNIEVVNLKEGSNELKNANLRLKDELLEVAKGNTEVADSAYRASLSIHPLTGNFNDNKEALRLYKSEVDKFQMEALIESVKKASKAIKDQNVVLDSWFNKFKLRASQAMSISTALGQWMVDIFSGATLSESDQNWNEWIKKSKSYGEKFQAALEFSEMVENFDGNLEEMLQILAEWKKDVLILEPQQQLIDGFDNLRNQAISVFQKIREEGKIDLTDSIESVENFAETLELGRLESAMFLHLFKQLKKESEKTPDNIMEKWLIEDDPSFLTDYIEKFTELNGVLSDTSRFAEHEEERGKILEDYQDLIATIKDAPKEGEESLKFWKDYYQKLGNLSKRSADLIADISKDASAQDIIAFKTAMETRDRALGVARKRYENDAKEFAREQESILKIFQETVMKIILGDSDDYEVQKRIFEENLKEREAKFATHIANLEQIEAGKRLTEEQSNIQQRQATLAFYRQSILDAEKYRDKIDGKSDPDEYSKRNKLVLEAERKFQVERAKYMKATANDLESIEKDRINAMMNINSAIHQSALAKQSEAIKTLESQLKESFEKNELSITEYYQKQRDLAEQDAEFQKQIIEERKNQQVDSINALIAASNSEAEQSKLKNSLEVLEIETKRELSTVTNQLAEDTNNLTAAEEKALKTARSKAQGILNNIQKQKDQAASLTGLLTHEQEFQNEMSQIRARHAKEIEDLKNLRIAGSVEEIDILKAQADQEAEIRSRIVAHEREMYQLRLEQNAEFAGNMSEITKGMMELGLFQSKKMFKIYQAFASAEAVISAYAAANDAFKNAMQSGNSIFAYVAYAAALAKGLISVAAINAQKPAFAEGGLIGGSSPHKKADNVDIRATAGEYVHPVDSVKAYGINVMEAIRKRLISPSVLKGLVSNTTLPKFSQTPKLNFAEGGLISNQGNTTPSISINMTNQSGVGLGMKQEQPKFDGKKWVIGIVLDELNKKGSFTKNLQTVVR